MKVSVDLPDAEQEIVDRLLATRGAGVVSTSYPSTALTYPTLHFQVELEASDTDDYPILERAQVRVTCHGAGKRPSGGGLGTREAVKEAVGDVMMDLYSWAGNANVSSVKPTSGRSNVSKDPSTGNLMCWALFQVNLRATTVAS